jgi:hypothetical protein
MTTLPLRAPQTHTPFADALARVAEAIDTMFEVFEDAQQMAREAHKRYPFIEY